MRFRCDGVSGAPSAVVMGTHFPVVMGVHAGDSPGHGKAVALPGGADAQVLHDCGEAAGQRRILGEEVAPAPLQASFSVYLPVFPADLVGPLGRTEPVGIFLGSHERPEGFAPSHVAA
ncbi:hypothetical protein SDC9_172101 [bioreactor metagenome]|uniref:Uncharacterized protein n=1 Tax=bioreactor metagenome TaxID=1076179 RepID=A0A645GFZ7_9ZZZZ